LKRHFSALKDFAVVFGIFSEARIEFKERQQARSRE
jgi:hypothetical protein